MVPIHDEHPDKRGRPPGIGTERRAGLERLWLARCLQPGDQGGAPVTVAFSRRATFHSADAQTCI